MSAAPALALRDIRKSFGGVHALEGATLVVERGSVRGLVGQNGAGKSTLNQDSRRHPSCGRWRHRG